MQKNTAQERVIENIYGQMIVIACPGSGKTTTILRRIRHMTAEEGIDPEKVLMITFTKAAADEMKSRYETIYGSAEGITFCTIHALCLALLKKFAGYTTESVLSNPSDILFELIRYNRNINDKGNFVQDLMMDITRLKNSYVPLSSFQQNCCKEKELFVSIYEAYEQKKEEMGQIDFDDLLLKTLELLTTDMDALQWIRQKYQFIHVDEYQDTNEVQRDIIYQIAGEDGNMVVVGDDDQSIYAFRGANPEVMLNFSHDYPKAEQVYMTTNYRSDRKIIEAAKAVISNNSKRYRKEFLCSSSKQGEVWQYSYQSRAGQIASLAQMIKGLIEKGANPSDIAVLYRTNSEADALVMTFSDLEIPFYSNDRLQSRYNHWIYRDIVSYHKVANHEGNKLDVQRTITHPNRYFKGIHVPDYDYDPVKMYQKLKDPNAEEWKNKKLKERLNEYIALLRMIKNASPDSLMQKLMVFGDYKSYLISYAEYRNEDPSVYMDLWKRYLEDISKHNIKTFHNWDLYRRSYEKKLAEIQSSHTGVCLSTMHKSKGLEWKYVFVIDCVEGTIPYQRNNKDTDIEDERRLFYVAMTRAKNTLWLLSYQDKEKKAGPSRFLLEIGKGN